MLHNLLIKPLTVTNYKLMLVLIDSIMNLDCAPIKDPALRRLGGIKEEWTCIVSERVNDGMNEGLRESVRDWVMRV